MGCLFSFRDQWLPLGNFGVEVIGSRADLVDCGPVDRSQELHIFADHRT